MVYEYSHEYSTAAMSSPTNTFDIDLDDDNESPTTDTFESTAALQVRQLERERRLRAIDRTFQNVVDEADEQIRSVSLNFTPDGAAHNEVDIRNMEDQIIASQPKSVAGKIKVKAVEVATQQVNRFTNNDQKYQLEMQSKAAAGNFEDFLPQSNFRSSKENGDSPSQSNFRSLEENHSKDSTESRPKTPAGKLKEKAVQVVEQVTRFAKKSKTTFPLEMQSNTAVGNFDDIQSTRNNPHANTIMFNTILTKCRQHRSQIGLAFLALLLIMATTITVGAISDSPSVLVLSEKTMTNLRLIRGVLIHNGFDRKHFDDEKSPQFTAIVQLAEEVTMKELSIDSVKDKTLAVVEMNHTTNELTNFNVAYAEQLVLIERYVLLAVYYVTTEYAKWKRTDNWLANDRHVCDDWQGVQCRELSSGNITLKVVTSINLSSNNMAGSIPKELCSLHQLEVLNLQDNDLSGLVPDCVGRLHSLKKIHLSRNSLRGEIPAGLCTLKSSGFLKEIVSDCGGGSQDDIECDCCTECL